MYLGFRLMQTCAGRLPWVAAQALGRRVGALLFWLLPGQRRLALSHLALALGKDTTPAQRRRLAVEAFQNLGQTALEWCVLPRLSARHIQALVTVEGLDHLRAAQAQGEGVVVAGAHFGNWEIGPLYLRSVGFDGAVLARRLRYPEYESFLINMRGKKGVATLARGSLKDVARILRAGQLVGVLVDQDVDSLEGVHVDFFGRPAYTIVGPAALSLMTKAPVVPLAVFRQGRGFRVVLSPALTAPANLPREQALVELTRQLTRAIEAQIRQQPGQWVWMHRRWKTPAPASVTSAAPRPAPGIQPALAMMLGTLLCASGLSGCAKKPQAPTGEATQQMSGFVLTGYKPDGSKNWQLHGTGANVEGPMVTVLKPDAVGYDPERTAYLTASAAQINQTNRHVRMENDVTIHTSDGLWFTSPVLHWMPDRNEMATDQPVRIETDHMLVRGRGAQGLTQLKHATIFEDVEMVLNPTDHEAPGGPKQVIITCDGPLSFDYERNVATFENNVHVVDPNGDLYSDTLVAYLNPATHTIRYAEATGKVRIHQQQNTALSERAVYEPAIGKITLVGRPSLLLYPDQKGAGVDAFATLGAKPATVAQQPKDADPAD